MTEPLLRVEGLTKHFPVTRGVFGRVVGQVRAVDGVSFEMAPGETLGVVGESGCGKTTAGRCVLRLIEPTAGRVVFDGRDVTRATPAELTRMRRDMQIVFQDPYSSLNPRLRVVDLIGEALEFHGLAKGAEVERRVADLLRRVGLSPSWINRYPHEFSGGQRQRIGVARAIALEPKLVVCDEAVSALDVSIQAQVVNLLIQLRREMNLSYLFIAHDLSVVRHISHRIAVMYLGQVVELGSAKRLFRAPAHPYTRALLSAIPVPDPERKTRRLVLTGDVPTPLNPPSGCRFHTRCPAVRDECRVTEPPSVEVESGHTVSCVHAHGLAGDPDWFTRMTARIDDATTENAANHVTAAVHEAPPRLATDEDEPTSPPPGTSKGRAREDSDDGTPSPAKDSRVGMALAGAGVVLGFGIIIAAQWAVGALIAVAAYFVFRTRPGKRSVADGVFVGVLLTSFAVGSSTNHARQRRTAKEQLVRLSAELADHQRVSGSLPASLSDLGWRLYPLFDTGQANDPWGRAWEYRAPGTEGRSFDLGSLGADGVRGPDDIGHVPPSTGAH